MSLNNQTNPASAPETETEEPLSVPIPPEFIEDTAAEELPFTPVLSDESAETEIPPQTAEQPESPSEEPQTTAENGLPEPSAEESAPAPAQGIPEEQFNALLAQITGISAANAAKTAEELSGIRSKMAEMDARVSSLRRLADMHQDIEKKLNDEINEYKDNFYRRIVNPILVEFFEIQENMHADALDADESAAALLNGYVDAISRTLKHYGVTVETVSVGDTYDPRIHKPVRAVPTEDSALDKTIAKTRQTLVHFIDGKIVERAQVQVYQFTPAAENAAE